MLKKIVLLSIILCSCSSKPEIIRKPIESESYKGTIAVLNFKNNTPYEDWDYMESGIADILSANLANQPGIEIVERENLKKVIDELKLSLTGLITETTAAKIGKLAGAHVIVMGSFTLLGDTIVISARLVKVETGEIYG